VDVVVLTAVERSLGELALASDPRPLSDDDVVHTTALDAVTQLAELLAVPACARGRLQEDLDLGEIPSFGVDPLADGLALVFVLLVEYRASNVPVFEDHDGFHLATTRLLERRYYLPGWRAPTGI
jgi:hypothetical protein